MNKNSDKTYRIIISGGGTGGHVFPAIAIANQLREEMNCEILFVGAKGKLEMQKAPEAGYKIIGLPISGFQRRLSIKNFLLIFRLIYSLIKSYFILKKFKPDIAIGVGGYASGPLLRMANLQEIPTLIQEQNSYPGVTNRILAKNARCICVAYLNMDRYFPANKIVLTGNPVRQNLVLKSNKRAAFHHFNLDPDKKTVLILGGSLGARTINESILQHLDRFTSEDVQALWQTGRIYYDNIVEQTKDQLPDNVRIQKFIERMDYAYATADLIISRAGAGTISEITLLEKPSILVPSPNVAEDHQTRNAQALVENNAAILVTDKEARENLVPKALDLVRNDARLRAFKENAASMGIQNSAALIVNEIRKIITKA